MLGRVLGDKLSDRPPRRLHDGQAVAERLAKRHDPLLSGKGHRLHLLGDAELLREYVDCLLTNHLPC